MGEATANTLHKRRLRSPSPVPCISSLVGTTFVKPITETLLEKVRANFNKFETLTRGFWVGTAFRNTAALEIVIAPPKDAVGSLDRQVLLGGKGGFASFGGSYIFSTQSWQDSGRPDYGVCHRNRLVAKFTRQRHRLAGRVRVTMTANIYRK